MEVESEPHLSTPTASDYRGQSTSREVHRKILQNLLPPESTDLATTCIINLGLYEFSLESIHERCHDVNLDPKIPDGNIGRPNAREGEVLPVVVGSVPFSLCRFSKRWTPPPHIRLVRCFLEDCASVGRGHGVDLLSTIERERKRGIVEGCQRGIQGSPTQKVIGSSRSWEAPDSQPRRPTLTSFHPFLDGPLGS